jgi:hypothetical protein
MREFKDFGIQVEIRSFTGDKIDIDRILNRPISILEYKIGPSKFKDKGNGKCLTLQIQLGDEIRIVFTSGSALMDVLERVPKDNFPFSTIIVKNDRRLIFT